MNIYNEKFTLNNKQACMYIKVFLEKECLWKQVNWQVNNEIPEWVFTGYILYKGKKVKVMKILSQKEFLKFLKKALFLSKSKLAETDIEVREKNNYKFLIKFNRNASLIRKRRK